MEKKLSALMDGDLDEVQTQSMLGILSKNQVLRNQWEIYCLIGDVLKEEKASTSTDFVSKVMNKLEEEPTLFVPQMIRRSSWIVWDRVLPLAASIMGFAAIGWVMSSLYFERPAAEQIQQASESTVWHPMPVAQGVQNLTARHILGDEQNAYLFAHQFMTGLGAVQYVRAVSMPENKEEM